MISQNLREAITAVQSGNRDEAQELLLALVREDPQNEMAWLWLSDVIDNVDDRIIALENAIAINPQRVQTRKRLAQVRREAGVLVNGDGDYEDLRGWENGRRQETYRALIHQVQHAPDDAAAWYGLSQLVDSVEDQIIFLGRTVQHNPSHREARVRLTQLQLTQDDNIALAKAYEAQNDLLQAAHLYKLTLNQVKSTVDEAIAKKRLRQVRRLHHLYRQQKFIPPPEPEPNYALAQGRVFEEQGEWERAIVAYQTATENASTAVSRTIAQKRLETAVRQRDLPPIKLSSPTYTLWRMSLGPTLLYGLLWFLHSGFKPLSQSPLLALGGLIVLLGSFIGVIVMHIPHHTLGQTLLGTDGRADFITRTLLNVLSVVLISIPFIFLAFNALQRLAIYQPMISN
ncbi:MAG: tetratricopeptide repeat protein [Ardenticatenaceae bacterium]|nr:tetratricopeptide repeat protein [Anaerolineales bacterium]MCB8920185.1 tetratricopeptide repeat protein [Ardenticatenaceae bacterium]